MDENFGKKFPNKLPLQFDSFDVWFDSYCKVFRVELSGPYLACDTYMAVQATTCIHIARSRGNSLLSPYGLSQFRYQRC